MTAPSHRTKRNYALRHEDNMLTRLAFRNLFRNGRRSAITLLVIVFGAVGLILFGGYKTVTFRNLREPTIRARLGHLQAYRPGFSKAPAPNPLAHRLELPNAV